MTSSTAMMSDAKKFSGMVDEASNAGETEKVASTKHKSGFQSFLSFLGAILDIINPLQHIPVISTIYRNITGDEISPMARVAGDALYGGPIGAAVGLANVAVEHKTGKDIGENVMAMFNKKSGKDTADDIQVAENKSGQRLQDIAWNDAVPASENSGDRQQGVLFARNEAAGENGRASLSTAAPAATAPQQPVHDDGARNALMAFARDMRGGAQATQNSGSAAAMQEIDVTTQIKNDVAKNDKPQGVLYARDDAAAEKARLSLNTVNAIQQDFPSSPGPAPTKLSYRTGATGNGPAAYSYKDGTMVPTAKSGPAGGSDITSAQGKVNVKTALLSQEVPADAGENRAVPPELIARQMMAGLDKYAAMSRLSAQPAAPATF
ncbi:MAG: hypothetical protein PSY14_13205 [bacterium]|nr:hypothetical protein [bacterium]